MKISVVIPIYNAKDTILVCLKSLDEQEPPPYEVILIDNNSTDDSLGIIRVEMIRFNNLKILISSESKKGPAAARNKGLGMATGDIIAFIDSDCIAGREWVKNINSAFEDDSQLGAIGGVEGGLFSDISLIGKFLSVFWLAAPKRLCRSIILSKEDFLRDNYISTFNCAFKRSILLDIGGFDETFFPSGEDIDLWMRALEKKAKIIAWDHNIVISHQQNLSFRGLMKKTFAYGEASAHLSKRHFRHKIIFQIPKLGQYKFNGGFITIVVTQHFAKLFLLMLIITVSLCISLILAVIIFFCVIIYLFFNIKLSIIRKGYKISLWDNILVFFLFVCRECIEEMGRIYGSLRYRVICF